MTWRVHPLVTAELDVPRPLMVWRDGFGDDVRVVALAWLIENGTDVVVVDTGVGGVETRPDLPQQYWPMEGANWTPLTRNGIIGALGDHGVAPSDVGHVVLTHLHFDHCGNLPLFDRATVYASGRGLAHSRSAVHRLEARYPYDVIEWMHRNNGAVCRSVPEALEILPGMVIRHLGGHTPCSQAVVVDSDRGPLVLAGDVVPLFENLDDDRPTGNYHHLGELIDASRLARSWGTVLPSHDPRTPSYLDSMPVVTR